MGGGWGAAVHRSWTYLVACWCVPVACRSHPLVWPVPGRPENSFVCCFWGDFVPIRAVPASKAPCPRLARTPVYYIARRTLDILTRGFFSTPLPCPCPRPVLAHRATDDDEKARIRSKGGKVVQGRVMGVLEPSRVIGVSLLRNLAARCVVGRVLFQLISSGLFFPTGGDCPTDCF